ncbi:MAG TPA: hypothetical protein VK530_00670 [Candidatus Acidoferrum sp.]|nr:hypothetical protein [Candidatus Acidoferrum sp.]
MKTFRVYFTSIALAAFVLTGCQTRSISDSAYQPRGAHTVHAAQVNGYAGELNEADVLGIQRNPNITEADIARALSETAKVHLRKGSSVLLIQSGARFPDDAMVSELGRFVNVVPFNGTPGQFESTNYSAAMRYAAAKGGCETIVCYWGVLESARTSLDSKAVSWVPIVGSVMPDETQHMRIRLKIALVDVRSGNWTVFSPEAYQDEAVSMRARRERSDQAQVIKLKQLAYETAARNLVKMHGR